MKKKRIAGFFGCLVLAVMVALPVMAFENLVPDFRVDQDAGTGSATYAAIATDLNNNFIITWSDFRSGNWDIYARGYASDGTTLGEEFRVGQDAGSAHAITSFIATDLNNNFIIAWEDMRSGNSDIYVRRFASDGTPLGNG